MNTALLKSMGAFFLKPSVRIVTVVILLLLQLSGVLDKAMELLVTGKIRMANTVYVEKSIRMSAESFAVVSEIKNSLNTIESSETGFSILGVEAKIRIGQFTSTMASTIDRVWQANQLGMSILFSIDIILKVSAFIAPMITGIFVLAWLVHTVVSFAFPASLRIRRVTAKTAELLLVFAAMFYLLIPCSVYVAGRLSNSFTHPVHKESTKHLTSLHQQVTPMAAKSHEIFTQVNLAKSDAPSPTAPKPAVPKTPESEDIAPTATQEAQVVDPVTTKPVEKRGIFSRVVHGIEHDADQSVDETKHAVNAGVKDVEKLPKTGVKDVEHVVKAGEHLIVAPIHAIEKRLHDMHEMIVEAEGIMKENHHNLTRAAHRLVAVYILDVFVFPLGLLWMCYLIAREVAARLFTIEDVERIKALGREAVSGELVSQADAAAKKVVESHT